MCKANSLNVKITCPLGHCWVSYTLYSSSHEILVSLFWRMVGLVGLDSLVNIVFRLWFMIWNVLIVQIFFAPSEMSKVWNYNRFIVFFLYVFWIMNEKIGYHILLANFSLSAFFPPSIISVSVGDLFYILLVLCTLTRSRFSRISNSQFYSFDHFYWSTYTMCTSR